jgi:hypothetical protein
MADFLSNIGFTEEEVQLAVTQIISRAVILRQNPLSKNSIKWMNRNRRCFL